MRTGGSWERMRAKLSRVGPRESDGPTLRFRAPRSDTDTRFVSRLGQQLFVKM